MRRISTDSDRRLDYRAVLAGLRRAVARSGLVTEGRFSPHSLRHGYASLLIAEGLDVVFVAGQLGHAKPTTTLSTYAHLFEKADHAKAARRAVEVAHGAMLGCAPG